MDIRRLHPDDAPEYRRLRIEAAHDPAFASDPGVEAAISVELLRKVLDSDGFGEVILGAFDNERLLGMVGLGRSDLAGTATLFGLFVAERERHKGIGRALVRALIHRLDGDADVDALELLVHSSNDIAKALYETEGFMVEGSCNQSTLRMRFCF